MTDSVDDVFDNPEPQPGFDLFAKFGLALGKLTDELVEHRRMEQQRLARLPIYIGLARMSSPGAAVTDLVDFQGPQPGRMWVVRLLTALASPLAANVAVVTWYVGQIMPGPAAGMLPSTMAVWQFPSVPGFQNFTSDVIKVMPGEHLIAGLTAIPAASNIALKAAINDQPLFAQRGAVAVE
jgi:hypothetical protein